MPPPFVVFSLPRSRSKWLSAFLSYGGWHCGHDEVAHCRSLDDVTSWLAQPRTGTVETAAAPFWRLLPPGVRVATLRRPVADVVASYARAGLVFEDAVLTRLIERHERKLDQIERRLPNVLSLTFADLADEAGCARMFEHCLGLPHDRAWWEGLAPLNLQIDMSQMLRHAIAFRPQMERAAKLAAHRCLATMQRQPHDRDDGVTFQHEPWRLFYRDAKPLLAEHAVQAGMAPDRHETINLKLFEMLDDAGMLQTITARQNGRMFGYLVSVVGPTLEAPDVIEGWHNIYFASPDMPGIGMRLQRAALDGLRERGAKQVLMRAGVRASGPRLGTLYKRLGAEAIGQMYQLEL